MDLDKYISFIVLGLISFFSPITPALIFVGMLVMADWITGIIKAHKTNTVKSRLMIRKFYSGSAYLCVLLVVRMAEIYFENEVPMVKPVVCIIALSELQSLRENVTIITGSDPLKYLFNFLEKKRDESE